MTYTGRNMFSNIYMVRKMSSPPGFDPRTVQPVASRYTDSAIPAASYLACVFVQLSHTIKTAVLAR